MSIFISVWLLCGLVAVVIMATQVLKNGHDIVVGDIIIALILAAIGPFTLAGALQDIGFFKIVIWRAGK